MNAAIVLRVFFLNCTYNLLICLPFKLKINLVSGVEHTEDIYMRLLYM